MPFGEYMPFGGWLERFGVTQFVHMPGGFDAGTGDDKLHVPGLPTARALICYEAIFPNERGENLDDPDPPRWLLNVTDDAWFGLTAGPYQHFAEARLRAIETGLPLARAANTGISAVVDGRGRLLAERAARRRGGGRQPPARAARPDLATALGIVDRRLDRPGFSRHASPCRAAGGEDRASGELGAVARIARIG